MNKDPIKELSREARATVLLTSRGWTPQGNWRFQSPRGQVHDLSAADLEQLDRVQRYGLFLVH